MALQPCQTWPHRIYQMDFAHLEARLCGHHRYAQSSSGHLLRIEAEKQSRNLIHCIVSNIPASLTANCSFYTRR